MKIIAVLTDSKRKSVAFVTDAFKVISTEEVVRLVKKGGLLGMHVVRRGDIEYVRTNPSPDRINIDDISIPWYWIMGATPLSENLLTTHALNLFWKAHRKKIEELKESGEIIIAAESYHVSTKTHIQEKLAPHKKHVFNAAEQYGIDPYLLGAILIDEIIRLLPFEHVIDYFKGYEFSKNATVGISQVALETARDIVASGYYNPNPSDDMLSVEHIRTVSRKYLYAYVSDDAHSVFFGAAQIRRIIDTWESVLDLSDRPEIVATVYSIGLGEPKENPKASARGSQIANKFYALAKEILGSL